jgi:hypothetical protein
MSDAKIKRREFVKRAAYAAPIILTLKARPAFAAAGSGRDKSRGRENRAHETESGKGARR